MWLSDGAHTYRAQSHTFHPRHANKSTSKQMELLYHPEVSVLSACPEGVGRGTTGGTVQVPTEEWTDRKKWTQEVTVFSFKLQCWGTWARVLGERLLQTMEVGVSQDTVTDSRYFFYFTALCVIMVWNCRKVIKNNARAPCTLCGLEHHVTSLSRFSERYRLLLSLTTVLDPQARLVSCTHSDSLSISVV